MMLYLLLCSILIYPLVCSGSVALSLPTKENNSSLPSNGVTYNDSTKLDVLSEGGGTLLASTPDLSLSKDKQLADLLELDGELDKHKKQSVMPRKGVDNYNDTVPSKTTELVNGTGTRETDVIVKNLSHPLVTKLINKVIINKTLATSEPISTIKVPRKPLFLSYEALGNADKNIPNDETKIPAINTSSKTLLSSKNQIPSPNEDSIVKVYPSKANNHPEMIMPIVITILVVPMFAIVGYMALRRGQEAWKNRHYKRMDFLLDGMYND